MILGFRYFYSRETIDGIKNWVKCNLATNIHLQNNLLEILHNTNKDDRYSGLPEDPAALYRYFDSKRRLIGLKGSRKQLQLFQDHYKLVLPSNKQEVDSQSFDINLIVALIRFLIVECPFAETVKKAVNFRRDLKHKTLNDFKTEQQLETNLITIHNLLKKMNYSKLADFVVADYIKDDKFLLDTSLEPRLKGLFVLYVFKSSKLGNQSTHRI